MKILFFTIAVIFLTPHFLHGQELLNTFKAFSNDPFSVITFSPDGQTILGANIKGQLYFWSTSNGSVSKIQGIHESKVNGLVFTPSGNQFYTISNNQMIKKWDYETGELLNEEQLVHIPLAIEYSQNNQLYLVTNKEIILLNQKHQKLYETTNEITAAAISNNGIILLAIGNELLLFDIEAQQVIENIAVCPTEILSVDMVKDKLACRCGNGEVNVWKRLNSTYKKIVKNKKSNAKNVAISFSNDGVFVAAGTANNSARFWQVAKGKKKFDLTNLANRVSLIAFNSDNTKFITAIDNGSIILWQLNFENPKQEIRSTKSKNTPY